MLKKLLPPVVKRKLRLLQVAHDLKVVVPPKFNAYVPRNGKWAHILYKRVQKKWEIPQTGYADPVTLDHLYPWRVKEEKGVDISDYQKWILLPFLLKIKRVDGVTFVIVQATQGMHLEAQFYGILRAFCYLARIQVGAYHFARPQASSGATQADKFIDKAKPRPGDLFPALDLEDTGGLSPKALEMWVTSFVDRVKERGFPCMIYTNGSTAEALPPNSLIGLLPLWIAHPGAKVPINPTPWKTYNKKEEFWQNFFGEKGGKYGLDWDIARPGARSRCTIQKPKGE